MNLLHVQRQIYQSKYKKIVTCMCCKTLLSVNLKSFQHVRVCQTKIRCTTRLKETLIYCIAFLDVFHATLITTGFSLRTFFISRNENKNETSGIYHSYISVVAGLLSHWGKLASPFLHSACSCRFFYLRH